jgi:hypothetical protein
MLVTLAAAMIGFVSIVATMASSVSEASTEWLVFLFAAGTALGLYKNRPMPTYRLRLGTSTGEVRVNETDDRNAIIELKSAIDRALAQGH